MINTVRLARELERALTPRQAAILADFVCRRVQRHVSRRLLDVHSLASGMHADGLAAGAIECNFASSHASSCSLSPPPDGNGSDLRESAAVLIEQWRLLPSVGRHELNRAVQEHEEAGQLTLQAIDKRLAALAADQELGWGAWRRQLEDVKFHSKTLYAMLLGTLYVVIIGDYFVHHHQVEHSKGRH